LRGSGDRI